MERLWAQRPAAPAVPSARPSMQRAALFEAGNAAATSVLTVQRQPVRIDNAPPTHGPTTHGPTRIESAPRQAPARLGDGPPDRVLVPSPAIPAHAEIKDTPWGTFAVVPDREAPKRPSPRDAQALVIGQRAFAKLSARLNAIESGTGNLTVTGDSGFRMQALADLAWLATIPVGLELLTELGSARHTVEIRYSQGAMAACHAMGKSGDGDLRPNGKPGPGVNAIVTYPPLRPIFYQPADPDWEPWMAAPVAIALAHELVHAYQLVTGTTPRPAPVDKSDRPQEILPRHGDDELRTVGMAGFEKAHYTENRFRAAFGLPLRTRYNDMVDLDVTPR